MKTYLTKKKRIVLKWYLPALAYKFVLQRKKWWGWKTVSWTSPEAHKSKDFENVKKFLEWKESFYSVQSPKDIGKRLMKEYISNHF
jgi:hypothetical protein